MRISISSPKGVRPKSSAAKLADNEAVVAENCKLWSGDIEPWNGMAIDGVVTSDTSLQSVWKYRNSWLTWDTDVDCVRSLLADDARDILMYTGDGVPKYRTSNGDIFTLGIPVPATAPSTTRSGSGTTSAQTVFHCYTYVTSAGWEGPNSEPSSEVTVYSGDSVSLSNISTPPDGYDITKIRIYRSVSGTSAAAFEYVAEIDPATTYTDTMGDQSGDILATSTWLPPSDTLTGLVALPGGMLAGFDGREIRFSEPYIPYGWPDSYSYMVPFDIVGLGTVGTSLVVMTEGPVYVLSGTSPDSMYVTKLPTPAPCLSKRSIVSSEMGVVFASSDGLYVCDGSTVSCMTGTFYSRSEWDELSPSSIIAGKLEGKYFFFSTMDGETRGNIIDLRNTNSVCSTVSVAGLGLYVEDGTNDMYVLHADNSPSSDGPTYFISQWEGSTDIHDAFYFKWRSKEFELSSLTNFSCARVRARYVDAAAALSDVSELLAENEIIMTMADSLGGDLNTLLCGGVTLGGDIMHDLSQESSPNITFRLFADGEMVFSKAVENSDPFRLPGGFKGRRYQIQVEGNFAVQELTVATSITELKA